MRQFLLALAIAFVSTSAFADADSVWGIDTDSDGTNEINLNTSGVLTMPDGLSNQHEYWYNPPAADTETVVHSVAIATYTVALSTTQSTSGITQMAKPMSIRCSFDTITGSSNVRGNVVIIGVDAQGNAQTETMDIRSLTVAESTGAYASITSIKYTLTANADGDGCYLIYCNAGPGVKIGLANNVSADADVYKVIENGTNITTFTVNEDYDTLDFATDPNGSSYYEAWYTVDSSQ